MFNANDYFKTLSEKHADILHTEEKPRFFIEHSTSDIIINQSKMLDRLRTATNVCLVSQFNGTEEVLGTSLNNANAVVPGALFLIKKQANKDWDNIAIASDELKNIWMDFRTKIKQDMRSEIIPHFLLEKIKVRNLGIIINGFVGIMIMLSYVETRCFEDRGKFN